MRISVFLCMILLFVRCGDLSLEGDATVRRAVGRLVQALEDRDMRLLRDHVAKDGELVVLGPDSGQTAVGWDNVQILLNAFFERTEETSLLVRDQSVRFSGSKAACVFQRVHFQTEAPDGEILSRFLRCTLVLERRFNHWEVVLIHLSDETDS